MLKDKEGNYIRRYLSTAPVSLWPDPHFTVDEQDIKRGLVREGAIAGHYGSTTQYSWQERVVDLYDEWLQKRGYKVAV